MINNSLKKFISVVMTGAIVFGMTGCLDFGGGKKEVLEAAETLGENIIAANANKLIKFSTLDKKDKEAESLTSLLSSSDRNDDEKAFFKAIEDSLEYEVDEESVAIKKDTATVDINITIADYEDIIDADYHDIDSLTGAIKNADTKEITFTAEFVKQDKEWIPDNVGSKKFMKIYDYRNVELSFKVTGEMIRDWINLKISEFWLSNNGTYVDTNFIQYDYFFDSAVLDYADRNIYVYYIVIAENGDILYTSEDILFGQSTNISCRYDTAAIGQPNALLDAGTYCIQLRMKEDDFTIDSQTAIVEHTEITVPTGNNGGNGGNGGSTSSGEGVYFDYYDQSFKQYVISADWFEYDVDEGKLTNGCFYDKSVEYIAFSIQVTADCNKQLTYLYYYAADENSLGDALSGSPIFSDTIGVSEYENGRYYDIDYATNGEAQAGYYIVIVFDADTNSNLLYGFCKVS